MARGARLLTGDWPAAEDLLEQTVTEALRTWRTLEDAGDVATRLRQWLVARYLDGHRSARVAVPLVAGASLSAGLRVLSAEDRAIVVSRYYLDLSAAEIAEVLDADPEQVAATAARLLEDLRTGAELGRDG